MPALETLLTAARERGELEAEVIETKALRRSDEVKTALLRAVSHDLRSPLTAIRRPRAAWPRRPDDAAARAVAGDLERDRAARRGWSTTCSTCRGSRRAAPPRRDWCSIEELIGAALGRDRRPGRGVRSRHRRRPAAGRGGRRPARAGAGEPARERRSARRREAGLVRGGVGGRLVLGSPTAGRASRARARARLRAVRPRRRRGRTRAWAGDRARLRRGQRRQLRAESLPGGGRHLRDPVAGPARRRPWRGGG